MFDLFSSDSKLGQAGNALVNTAAQQTNFGNLAEYLNNSLGDGQQYDVYGKQIDPNNQMKSQQANLFSASGNNTTQSNSPVGIIGQPLTADNQFVAPSLPALAYHTEDRGKIGGIIRAYTGGILNGRPPEYQGTA